MPKVPPKTPLKVSTTQTHVTDEATLLGGAYSDVLHSKKSMLTAKEIAEAIKEASDREKAQIKAFTEANQANALISKLHPFWFLVRIRDADTGHRFLAAGCRASGPGLSAKDFRRIIGLGS